MSCVSIGLVSDSHGRFKCLKQMADEAPDVAAWIHAGDYCSDAADLHAYTGVPVYEVRGNNDFMVQGIPDYRKVTIAGVTIIVTHGHQWYGNSRLEKLTALGRKNNAQLVVFGHTHRRYQQLHTLPAIVNPGSIALPRDAGSGTYSICTIENGSIKEITSYEL